MAIKILYYGSCWPTNIGNAFVNNGAKSALKEALGENAEIYHFGGMSSYLFLQKGAPQNNLNIADISRFDYVAMGGMTQCDSHYKVAYKTLKGFLKNNAKIIIMGGGAQDYNANEVSVVRSWMKDIPINLFISRDTYSYEQYGDLADNSYDGIDSAFFISDKFNPLPLNISDFVVLAFDTYTNIKTINNPITQKSDPSSSPSAYCLAHKVKLFILSHPQLSNTRLARFLTPPQEPMPIEIDLKNKTSIWTHHVTDTQSLQKQYFDHPDTLISDLPSDFLSLYAQASIVYSDRVHACIAALAFGNKAQLFGQNIPRLRMFERVNVPNIIREPAQVDLEYLTQQKSSEIKYIKDSLMKR